MGTEATMAELSGTFSNGDLGSLALVFLDEGPDRSIDECGLMSLSSCDWLDGTIGDDLIVVNDCAVDFGV